MMIEAARFEGLETTLKEQQVLAFKADTSIEKWNQLKRTCTDEEWDNIKKQLVVFFMKRDDKPQEKCELLMRDGLYQECIDIFPTPTGDPETNELDLLYELYDSIERNQPLLLEKLIFIVAKYIRRYFALHKYKALDKIMDRLQRRFPSVLLDLYSKACDLVLINLMRSQYEIFVGDCLKTLKQRMDEMNQSDDWKKFLRAFREKHKGKKKLLQMVELLEGGTFNINEIQQKKRVKKTKSKD